MNIYNISTNYIQQIYKIPGGGGAARPGPSRRLAISFLLLPRLLGAEPAESALVVNCAPS